jgi:nucleoid-associated protein YgaU
MNHKFAVVGVIAALLLGVSGSATAAEKKMTRDEYKAKLAEYVDREAKAKAGIEDCDAKIASLNSQLDALESAIAQLDKEILDAVGASEAQVRAYGKKLDSLIAQLKGLAALPPEELIRHGGELSDIASALEELKQSKLAALPEMAAKISRIEAMLSDQQDRRSRSVSITYEVMKGDHLWGIASKESIYADPYMWPRIYRANRDAIDDPDLIYPEQELTVPFGVGENQYLVTSGDFLSKIASAVYDDPTMWHKIYKANQEQIVEPSLIFPAQVLEVPAD